MSLYRAEPIRSGMMNLSEKIRPVWYARVYKRLKDQCQPGVGHFDRQGFFFR